MKNLVFLFAFLFTTGLYSQPVEDVVAAACGGAQTSNGVQYQWLLGEIMVELYADGISLDQGFGPAACFTVSTHDTGPGAEVALAAYPNPTTGLLHLESFTLKNYQAILHDMHGRQLLRQVATLGQAELRLDSLTPGIYLLAIWDDGRLIKSFIVQKLQ